MTHTELIAKAREAMKTAYVPYSHFPVGAALVAKDGTLYTGCNVEGASYGNAICAERTALVKAVSDGQREFSTLAVAANTDDFCTPCGICRQMLYEFAPDLVVLCSDRDGNYKEYTLRELLPGAFSAKDL
ncbi:MAG: cytidine deaminase [Clostridia bacterium]|nr:cytidine deaminase [Clostridia bacterium]